MLEKIWGRGFLSKLGRNQAGSTLAIVAAAMLPIIGMVGGGLDIGRVYIAKSRLQQACDAAVLAARGSMVGISWKPENETKGLQFFSHNFPAGKYGSQNVNLRFTPGDDGSVAANATGTMPMTLMRVFGFDAIPLRAHCKAELHLPNTDVMFVLDTTGSMADTNPSDTDSRIVVMRNSVKSFFTTLENARTAGSIIRYGFVPYSETVNVGLLLKRDWMVDNWTYQSRVADGTDITPGKTTTTTTQRQDTPKIVQSGSVETIKTNLPLEDCAPAANAISDTTVSVGLERQIPYTNSLGQTTDAQGKQLFKKELDKKRTRNGSTYGVTISGGKCVQTETKYNMYIETWTEVTVPETVTTTSGDTTNYYWNYQQVSFNVSSLKGNNANGLMAGGSVATMVGNNHTAKAVAWNGCIEERDTVTGTDYATAKDMDIDAVPNPTLPGTQWRPALAKLVFARSGMTSYNLPAMLHNKNNYQVVGDYMSGTYAVCPWNASKLGTITTLTALNTYLSKLTPSGQTYHDIGLIWGARLLSPTGIFRSENEVSTNGGTIARHMIFMTDGDTDTQVNHYDAYGFPALDRRRSPGLQTDINQNATVAARTAAICEATKNKGITLWVIAFGTALTDLLQNCATPGRAYQAQNAAELNARFAQIATQIAQLRITD
jgi:uncharacterized protein YlaN (UPF0358 family)